MLSRNANYLTRRGRWGSKRDDAASYTTFDRETPYNTGFCTMYGLPSKSKSRTIGRLETSLVTAVGRQESSIQTALRYHPQEGHNLKISRVSDVWPMKLPITVDLEQLRDERCLHDRLGDALGPSSLAGETVKYVDRCSHDHFGGVVRARTRRFEYCLRESFMGHSLWALDKS